MSPTNEPAYDDCGRIRHSSASAFSPASLGGRVWGGCFQSGMAALPFIGGQPLPPGIALRGFVWRGCPSAHSRHSGGRKSLSGKVPAGGPLFFGR